MPTDLISGINQSLEISIPESISLDQLKQELTVHINYLINHDFEKLVYYLYRIDVNEHKMRRLLDQNAGENAADLLADLIIERQVQKMESRKNTSARENFSDEEKW